MPRAPRVRGKVCPQLGLRGRRAERRAWPAPSRSASHPRGLVSFYGFGNYEIKTSCKYFQRCGGKGRVPPRSERGDAARSESSPCGPRAPASSLLPAPCAGRGARRGLPASCGCEPCAGSPRGYSRCCSVALVLGSTISGRKPRTLPFLSLPSCPLEGCTKVCPPTASEQTKQDSPNSVYIFQSKKRSNILCFF